MKVSVDPCPNCCNPRCPNCDTRRINTRSHQEHFEPKADLPLAQQLRLPAGKILVGIVMGEEDEEEGGTEQHGCQVPHM